VGADANPKKMFCQNPYLLRGRSSRQGEAGEARALRTNNLLKVHGTDHAQEELDP
jgi:hypothetical protein